MPPDPSPREVVDLCSDDESETNAAPAQAFIWPPNADQFPEVPIAGRLHGGYDIDTLEYEEHLIPEGQLDCRGCSLLPIEFDEDGNEIPADVTHAKRMKIITERFKEKWAKEDAEKGGADDNNPDTTNTIPLSTGAMRIHSEVLNSPGTSNTIQAHSNIAIHAKHIDLNTPDDQSAGSRTEASSDNEDILEVRPTPASTSQQTIPLVSAFSQATRRSLPTRKNKGQGRNREQEPTSEINLSLLESDNDYDNDANGCSNAANLNDVSLSDDEDLRKAIALSLQGIQIGNTADDDDAAFSSGSSAARRTLTNKVDRTTGQIPIVALSKSAAGNTAKAIGETQNKGKQRYVSPTDENDRTVSPSSRTATPSSEAQGPAAFLEMSAEGLKNSTPTAPFNLTGLDRKQMEAERLARLKRKRQGEVDNVSGPGNGNKVARVEHLGSRSQGTISPPPLRRTQVKAHGVAANNNHQFSTSASGPAAKNTGGNASDRDSEGAVPVNTRTEHPGSTTNYYPKGVVLKTRVAGYDTSNTIDFPTLLSPSSSLEACLLSSFIWNFDWLFPHFDTKRTKFQLVMHAKVPGQREALMADFEGVPNVRLCFPPMEANVNCMHSKLMLLFYRDEAENKGTSSGWKGPRCRIVVPTANLVDFDWGVGGIMENTVWLIDLPRKSHPEVGHLAGIASGRGQQTRFQQALTGFLNSQTVPDDVIRKLELFDFGQTAQLGFVHTIGGMHGGEGWRSTGLCGLGQTITDLGLASRGPIEMDCVTSSLGSLTDEFMRSMYLAAQGDDGLSEYERRTRTAKAGSGGRLALHGYAASGDLWKQSMRVYYPSDETIRRSKGGPSNAGTICFSSKWWHNGKFPKSTMRDCVSVREGLLMHNKIIFVRYAGPMEPEDRAKIGWTYVGSANLSESAWGRLVQDRATKQPRLNCRNWECGVIIPHVTKNSSSGPGMSDGGDREDLAVFDHLVPIPMRNPGERLEGKKPWTMFD